ncbi:MAG: YibE/F family protein, partial [Propionicimonas sp.]|nr:YibE/F family protein [Propionicimonas sp.]
MKWLLAGIMTVLVLATAAGAAALWPRDAPAKEPWLFEGAAVVRGVVVELVDDGGDGLLRVLLDDGRTVEVPAEPTAPLSEARIGQPVQIVEVQDPPDTFYFFDYERGLPLLALAAVFVLAVLVVARWKGLAALAGLAGALAVVWVFTLPALAMGRDPLLVALVTASMVMFVVVYLAHGISVKSTTALLGTFAGIAGVAALAWWAIPATSLTPLQDETMGQLPYRFPGIDARGILLCGMVLAGVGVLNDVTITQASAV